MAHYRPTEKKTLWEKRPRLHPRKLAVEVKFRNAQAGGRGSASIGYIQNAPG